MDKSFPLLSILITIVLFFVFFSPESKTNKFDSFSERVQTVNNQYSESAPVESTTITKGGGGKNVKETSSNNKKIYHSLEAQNYYKKIVFGSEYGEERTNPLKWIEDIKIYVDGEKKDYLVIELQRILNELNDIIIPIDLEIVTNKQDANFFIYFGSHTDFKESYDLVSPEILEHNWGYFEVYYASANMYVDLYRTRNIESQKHLLREELTQSLGLQNDSYDYPESIFYQGWTTTTEYAPIDRELIDMLYNN